MLLGALVLVAFLLGSAFTIQMLMIPQLMQRIQDRSAVTRISNNVLRRHHLISVLALAAVVVLLFVGGKTIAGALSAVLLALNLYQRFWIFTKLHLVKQPIGVQDLIQPDNVLREEFNRLQKNVYLLFRFHLLLLLIDLLLIAF